MSQNFAAAFPGRHEAERALDALDELERDSVLGLEDAVIVVRGAGGKVRLYQQRQVSIGEGLVTGGVVGVIVGLLLGFPVLAPIVGMGIGVAAGLFLDSGIDDARLKELGAGLDPGQAALCVQVSEADWPVLRERIATHAGELLVAELSAEAEAALRD